MTKRMTGGWISVFLLFAFMNIYTANRYQQIPLNSWVHIKQMLSLLIHGFFFFNTIHYFYHFFMGKTEHKYHQIQGNLAGFYLIFLHCSFLFHLSYDLVLKHFLAISYKHFALITTAISLAIALLLTFTGASW